MKKGLSILFSLLMVVIVVHPSLAMHFCGAALAEMTLMDGGAMADECCCGESDSNTHATCPDAGACCHTQVVSLDTDDYQSVSSPSVPMPVDCFLLAWLYTAPIEPTLTLSSVDVVAPPGVLLADDVSLPFICIFRI
jgi:hypothetical protein